MAVFRAEEREERVDALGVPAGMRIKPTLWQNLFKFVKDKPLGAFGGAIAILLIFLAFAAPVVATHNPELTDYRSVLAAPSSEMFSAETRSGGTCSAAWYMAPASPCWLVF